MELGIVYGVLLVVVIVFGAGLGVCLVSSTKLWVELKAMQKSTHTLQWIDPLKQAFGEAPTDKEISQMTADPLNPIQ